MKRVKFLFGLLTLLVMSFMTSCDEQGWRNNVETKTARQQEKLMEESAAQVGMPAITNFQEKKLMKMVMEARDNSKLVCYCYMVNEINGSVGQYLGRCIGYGLPYSTQFTNPMRCAKASETYEAGNVTLPQADPNGLYMPASAEATWVFLLDPKTGEPTPIYVEPKIIISPFPLK